MEIVGGALAKANETLAFATDSFPGRTVMDVEEYEGRLGSVSRESAPRSRAPSHPPSPPPSPQLRSECLSYAPRLFVEDGALGSSRAAELRVRVITDSPAVALYFKSMLHRIPLYAPEAFPRTMTVYAATLAGDGVSGWAGMNGKPFTVVDSDPATARCTVAAAGAFSLSALRDAVATAAGQTMATGGYRHVAGGSQNPNLAAARADGVLHWYMRDSHVYAEKGEAHPDLLPFRGDIVLAQGGGSAIVVGGEGVAGAAAVAKRLLAAHGGVWGAGATAGLGLHALWGGVSVPSAFARANAAAFPLGRGTMQAQGLATMPLEGGKAAPAPTHVVIVGGTGADAAAKFASAAGLTPKAAEKVASRLSGLKVTEVATSQEAAKALGL